MAGPENTAGGESLTWRQYVGLLGAWSLLATPLVAWGSWAVKGECDAWAANEPALAAYENRDPRGQWAICAYNQTVYHYITEVPNSVAGG